jgi:pimeloyl-ACP methyl ester carboxylesterase
MTGGNLKWNPPVFLHLKQQVNYRRYFRIEEVKFKDRDVTLAGSLFIPVSNKPTSAIIIIHGSGAGNRDKWTYNFWGYFFAKQGLATLIYDKRGNGESTGNLENASFDDHANDVVAGIEYLKTRKEIDKDHIGLFGSSQGGWLAPLAASKTDDVSFLILNVAPSVSVAKQEIDRVIYTMKEEGYTEEEIKLAKEYTEKMFEVSYNYGKMSDLQPLIDSVKNKDWTEILTIVENEGDFEDWRLQKYEPTSVLSKTTIPTFVAYGENDHTVPPAENKELMKQYLDKAGNKSYKIIVVPNIGHNMFGGQKLIGGKWEWPDSYWQWDKKSPILLTSIRNWLRKQGIIKE